AETIEADVLRRGSRKECECSRFRHDRTPDNRKAAHWEHSQFPKFAISGGIQHSAIRMPRKLTKSFFYRIKDPFRGGGIALGDESEMSGRSCSTTAECRSIRASATVLRRFAHALLPICLERLKRSLEACFERGLQFRTLTIRLHERQKIIRL